MLIAQDQSSGQYVWRANLEILDEYMDEIMHFFPRNSIMQQLMLKHYLSLEENPNI